jgi:hypothetical protein
MDMETGGPVVIPAGRPVRVPCHSGPDLVPRDDKILAMTERALPGCLQARRRLV